MPRGQVAMVESEITLSVHLEVRTRKQGSKFMAWCLPLDVFSQGPTEQKAIDALKEAVELWFESCVRRGVLDKALGEAGFKPTKDGEEIPSEASVVDVHERKRHVPQHAHRQHRRGPRYISVSFPAYTASRTINAGAAC